MRTTLWEIPGLAPGRLAIVGRPRGGDWLDDELRDFRAAGIDLLVSMLCPDEAQELGLEREGEAARAAGMGFVSFPVIDRGVPTAHHALSLLGVLHAALSSGRFVAVHCRMGIGRSSLACAALLRRRGLEAEAAWASVAAARGTQVPDTEEQRRWVAALSPP